MRLALCSAITAVALTTGAAAQPKPGDIIFSDSFDSVPLGIDQTSLPGWTITGGTIDVIGAPGYDPRPGHGHYLDMQGSSGHPGQLSILLPVPISGRYLVGFDWSGNPRADHGAIAIDTTPKDPNEVGLGAIIDVAADTPFLSAGHGTGVLSEGFFTLTFSTPPFFDTPEGHFVTGTGLLLDNVTVTFIEAIPEPGTIALLGVGLGMVGLVRRRSRR